MIQNNIFLHFFDFWLFFVFVEIFKISFDIFAWFISTLSAFPKASASFRHPASASPFWKQSDDENLSWRFKKTPLKFQRQYQPGMGKGRDRTVPRFFVPIPLVSRDNHARQSRENSSRSRSSRRLLSRSHGTQKVSGQIGTRHIFYIVKLYKNRKNRNI